MSEDEFRAEVRGILIKVVAVEHPQFHRVICGRNFEKPDHDCKALSMVDGSNHIVAAAKKYKAGEPEEQKRPNVLGDLLPSTPLKEVYEGGRLKGFLLAPVVRPRRTSDESQR